MARRLVTALFLLLPILGNPRAPGAESTDQHFLPMGRDLIPLNSKDGRELLSKSEYQDAYWSLSQFYSPQPDLNSCSVAACVMVLNALPIERPVSPEHRPFRLFTPSNFFTDDVKRIVTREKVSSSGMTLRQMSKVLNTFPVRADPVYASESDIAKFRDALAKLSGPEAYVIVNYLRSALDQEKAGHISPVGAYNRDADMVLILDTANYKYPWVWVKTDRLWKAMAEGTDPESMRSRGFVTIAVRP